MFKAWMYRSGPRRPLSFPYPACLRYVYIYILYTSIHTYNVRVHIHTYILSSLLRVCIYIIYIHTHTHTYVCKKIKIKKTFSGRYKGGALDWSFYEAKFQQDEIYEVFYSVRT
jgi:hypothetical protein